MKVLVKMLFGSRVYGTSVSESDTDYKQVFLPSFEDFVLFNAKRSICSTSSSDKNTSSNIDIESFELGRFLDLCMQGQTNAIDTLFTPKQFWIESSPTWDELIALKPFILNKKIQAMVGYCRSQASKYSTKGIRLNDTKAVLDLFRTLPTDDRLDSHLSKLEELCRLEHVEMTKINVGSGDNNEISALTVCGRHLPVTTKIGYCIENTLMPLYSNYGRRSTAAANASGADYKAMMHALRVSGEAIELMETGEIIFPLREADYLLRVRKGEVSTEEIFNEIDDRLLKLEDAVKASDLPKESNREVIEQFIVDVYREHLTESAKGN